MADVRLVGSNIKKISGFRNQNFSGKLSMETKIKILSIEKVKESKDTLKVGYSFEVDYKDLGNVFLEGNIFVLVDAKRSKDIMKAWEAKDFSTDENTVITNMIIQKASIKLFNLEDELGLPTHIRLPRVGPKKE